MSGPDYKRAMKRYAAKYRETYAKLKACDNARMNACESLDAMAAERDGLRKAYDCALRQMKEAIASAEWYKSENAKLKKQLDEARDLLSDAKTRGDSYMEAMDRARAERDKLATACERVAHSRLPSAQLEQFAIDALAAVNRMETSKGGDE